MIDAAAPGGDHRLRRRLGAEARALEIDVVDESQSASVMSRKSTRGKTPALLTRMSIRRTRRRPPSTIARTSSSRAISAWISQRAAAVARDRAGDLARCRLVVEPVDRDIGAGRGEGERDRAPDPLLRPGHQRDLASKLHYHSSINFCRKQRPRVLINHGSIQQDRREFLLRPAKHCYIRLREYWNQFASGDAVPV